MTCQGTERVFVNPAVCRLASAWRHKPLSAASPLTRVGARLGPGPGWGGLARAPASCPRCRGEGAKQSRPDGDKGGPGEGCALAGAPWGSSITRGFGACSFWGDLTFLLREMGTMAMATPHWVPVNLNELRFVSQPAVLEREVCLLNHPSP